MGRLRAIAIGLTLLAGGAWPIAGVPGVAGAPGVACATAVGPRAVLVVDDGARVVRLCVVLDAESVSGTRLIELASAQHGLTYSLGFGGQAVCMLAGVGPTGGDCFAQHPDFWGYWHGDGRGGWTWASGSAASYRVRDGAVEGWAWGSGDTPTTHAKPPSSRFPDVCPPAPSPSVPAPSPAGSGSSDGSTGNGGGSTGSTGAGGVGGGGGGSEPAAKADASRSPDDRDEADAGRGGSAPEPTTRAPRPSATAEVPDASQDTLRAAGATATDGAGPPIGLPLAILAGFGLAAAGWWRVRDRADGGAPNGDPR